MTTSAWLAALTPIETIWIFFLPLYMPCNGDSATELAPAAVGPAGAGERSNQEKRMPKPKRAEDDGRGERRRAVNDYRREIILAAARRVFADQGLEGASLRAIAKEAGYTHGALYFYYASKEEIYGDLLAGSLDRLQAAVFAAVDGRAAPVERLLSATLAFFDYYRDSPGDLDLATCSAA
jgi:hypothetical protein